MQYDDPWAVDPAGDPMRRELEQTELKSEPQPPGTLAEALLALYNEPAPVFAVLDGAQFDNLPQDLLLGDFVSRPLYRDRGDNNPEQIITAPHMVWLDERPEKPTDRAPKETIPALLALIANRPAVAFWQCPEGADALYKHLRGINMVMYPKAALTDFEEHQSDAIDEVQRAEASDTHTLVLFRHADSNGLAQTLPAMDAVEIARIYGPATRMIFAPAPDWANGQDWWRADRPENLPAPHRGHLRISMETVGRIEGIRLQRNRKRITAYLRRVSPDQTHDLDDATLDAMTGRYMNEARSYGVGSEAGMGRWAYLQVIANGRLSRDRNIHELMSVKEPSVSSDERVRLLLQQSVAAIRRGCA